MLTNIFLDLANHPMQTVAALKNPTLLQIEAEINHTPAFGCDQDWYHEAWQRQAGCGPCTSASILYYLSRQHDELAGLYALSDNSKEHFQAFMSEIWHYVTPGRMGVNEGTMLSEGVLRYARHVHIDMDAHLAKIPGLHQKRAPLSKIIHFIQHGLNLDCPVAFLNLSNGNLSNLESWHWVTLVALFKNETGEYYAAISDSGEPKLIRLGQWYESSLLGGTFVYFSY